MEKVKNSKLVWLGALIIAFTFMFSALIMPLTAHSQVYATADYSGDLTGTIWLLDADLGETGPYGVGFGNKETYTWETYDVGEFRSNGQSFSRIKFWDYTSADDEAEDEANVTYDSVGVWWYGSKYHNKHWAADAYRTIEIIDSANWDELLPWLNAHATLQYVPEPTPSTGVVEDTIAIALFATILCGAVIVVGSNKSLINNK